MFHEVIDNGNEPISTSEYYGVGKVTEFRSCTWAGSCIQNNDFNCLKDFGNVSINTYIFFKFSSSQFFTIFLRDYPMDFML